MPQYMCISATLLAGRYHGAEWPPAPARLFQALLAGSQTCAYRNRWEQIEPALRAIESLPAPEVIAADCTQSEPYRISVPNNDSDKAAREWVARREFNAADLRTLKTIRPRRLPQTDSTPHVTYIWSCKEKFPFVEGLRQAAHSLHTLGWGVDMAYADAFVADENTKSALTSCSDTLHFVPATRGETRKVPAPGYLDDLISSYESYCGRISAEGVNPSTRASAYAQQPYRCVTRSAAALARFALRRIDSDAPYSVPWVLGMKVAAWVRHAAAEALLEEGVDRSRVNSFVLGHGDGHARHLSFVPVPSIRTLHGDGAVRRVMIVEPQDSDGETARLLQWRLAPSVLNKLVNTSDNHTRTEPACILVDAEEDGVWPYYMPCYGRQVWRSVTPVVLHGFNARGKRFSVARTEELLYQAFEESGYPRHLIDELAFQTAPFWPGTEAAPAIRVPEHLAKWPRYHISVTFRAPVQGPVLVGIGRHYGIGLFAAAVQQS